MKLRLAALFRKGPFPMMMIGLILSVIGLAVAYAYSSILGAGLFLAGAALLARGYLKPDPEEVPARSYDSGGPVTYDIPSSKTR